MILRDYQKECVEKSITALREHSNTVAVAPTGSGKTVILSALIKHYLEYKPDFRVLVIAHRNELINQNEEKFLKIYPEAATSIVCSKDKNWSGQVVFAMVQTLSREHNLSKIPKIDLIVIDECHHIRAESYVKIIEAAKNINKDLLIFGVTATPNRGDKKGLGKIFSNCAYQIDYETLIGAGYLVPAKIYVSDVMNKAHAELAKLETNSMGEYRDEEVASILDTEPILDDVIAQWQKYASDRKTVIFCSTKEQAMHVYNAFSYKNIASVVLTGDTTQIRRDYIFQEMDKGIIQVIINVAVLTEGWDYPPISCVILLRMSSYESTYLQMVGRGLRTVNLAEHPNIEKTDCIILDFGISSKLHYEQSGLSQNVDLHPKKQQKTDRDAPNKNCKECGASLPARIMQCPLCGYMFLTKEEEKYEHNVQEMIELKVVQNSRFAWDTVTCNDKEYLFVCGFNGWVTILKNINTYIAVVGSHSKFHDIPVQVIYEGSRSGAIKEGNSFLYKIEDNRKSSKNAWWRTYPISDKQHEQIAKFKNKYVLSEATQGAASNVITFDWHARKSLKKLGYFHDE